MSTKTLNIALDERLLRQVDEIAKNNMASRSEYFRRLALADISRRQALQEIMDAGNRKGQALGFTDEDAVMDMVTAKDV